MNPYIKKVPPSSAVLQPKTPVLPNVFRPGSPGLPRVPPAANARGAAALLQARANNIVATVPGTAARPWLPAKRLIQRAEMTPRLASSSGSESDADEREERKAPPAPMHVFAVAPAALAVAVAGDGVPAGYVSASSAHHALHLLRTKAASAASKTYGFSFVDKPTETADVAKINEYIKHLKSGSAEPFLDSEGKRMSHGKATHAGAKPGMIQFKVNGRVYSTHADTLQLFPVSGAGIVAGKGIADMLKVLKEWELLDLKTFYAVATALTPASVAWKQLGKRDQAGYEEAHTAYMKRK
ncbi:MAG: hypothetical protein V4631_09685 [Pseudomonadota bacterium]